MSLADGLTRFFDNLRGESNTYHQSEDPNATRYVEPVDPTEAAERGSLFVIEDRLGGKGQQGVSVGDYENFYNTRDAFEHMINAWASEDDYDKRQEIIRGYVDKYGFNNKIHKDMLDQIGKNEQYYHENPIRDGDQMLPYDPFDIKENRQDWVNWVISTQEAAIKRYNPRSDL